MEWMGILVTGLLSGGGLASILVFIATRKRDTATVIAERFDDASELSRYIDDRVEAKVGPIRVELATVKAESHEMHAAVRARETQLWLWDQRGRPGQLPMLPDPILHRLGLGYMADDDWHTEPTSQGEPS